MSISGKTRLWGNGFLNTSLPIAILGNEGFPVVFFCHTISKQEYVHVFLLEIFVYFLVAETYPKGQALWYEPIIIHIVDLHSALEW